MKKTPVITSDLDKKCTQCGQPGAADSGLCLKCLAKNMETLAKHKSTEGKGGIMEGPTIRISQIEGLQVKAAGDEQEVKFKTRLGNAELARLLNFARQGTPMQSLISSPQARMDLRVEEIDLRSGEIKD